MSRAPLRRQTVPVIPARGGPGVVHKPKASTSPETRLGRGFTLMPKLVAIKVPHEDEQQLEAPETLPKKHFVDAYIILTPRDSDDAVSTDPDGNDGNTTPSIAPDWDLTFHDTSMQPTYIVWSVLPGQNTAQEQSKQDTGRGGLLICRITAEDARNGVLEAIRECARVITTQQGKMTSLNWATVVLETVFRKVKSHRSCLEKYGEMTVADDVGVLKAVLNSIVPNSQGTTVGTQLSRGWTLVDQNFLRLKLHRSRHNRPLSFSHEPIPHDIVLEWDAKDSTVALALDPSRPCPQTGALVLICGNRQPLVHKARSTLYSYNESDVECKLMVINCEMWVTIDAYATYSGRGRVRFGKDEHYDAKTEDGVLVGYGDPPDLVEALGRADVPSTEFQWAMDCIKSLVQRKLLLGPDNESILTEKWADDFEDSLRRSLRMEITVSGQDGPKNQAVWQHLNSQSGILTDDHYRELQRQWARLNAGSNITMREVRERAESWDQGVALARNILNYRAAMFGHPSPATRGRGK